MADTIRALKTLWHWVVNEAPLFELVVADATEWLPEAREIINEYARSLPSGVCFQDLAAELAGLPGEYAPPGGVLLLALVDGAVAGCGALRALPDCDHPNACEMRRLYVRRSFRRLGLGRSLTVALLDHARRMGYASVLLDTLDDMESARELYASLGFEPVAPYYYSPIAGAHQLKANLDSQFGFL